MLSLVGLVGSLSMMNEGDKPTTTTTTNTTPMTTTTTHDANDSTGGEYMPGISAGGIMGWPDGRFGGLSPLPRG